MAYEVYADPYPSPKADISNRSGHSSLPSAGLTFLNTAFWSLPVGCAESGGEIYQPTCQTHPCCLNTRTAGTGLGGLDEKGGRIKR